MPTAAQPTFRDKTLLFLSYVYVKGVWVSTALFVSLISIRQSFLGKLAVLKISGLRYIEKIGYGRMKH
jgi:hypothetical protein